MSRTKGKPFVWWDRVGSCWRTFQASVFGGCEAFPDGFPKSGVMRDGKLFRRRLLTPRSLFEKGSELWATPNANEDRAAAYTMETSYRHYVTGSHQVHLSQMVRDERMWPTPMASNPGSRVESKGGKILAQEVEKAEGVRDRHGKKWPTPVAHDHKAPNRAEKIRQKTKGKSNYGLELRDAVQVWPTPTATERSGLNPKTGRGEGLSRAVKRWPTPTAVSSKSAKGREGGPNLARVVEKSVGGQLNPTWVEWLMGYPLGWTEL